MGLDKNKRPLLAQGGLQVNGGSTFTAKVSMSGAGVANAVQSLTSTQTGTTVNAYGATFITSGSTAGSNLFALAAPVAGYRKTILVDVNTTDHVDVVTATSGSVFWGTTANAVRFSTGAVTPKRAVLFARTSTSWAVEYLSTGVTVVGTTF